jgi:hypothetical protein
MSGFYTYLGIRDVVRRREISETQAGSPTDRAGNIDESCISVTICRILISVWFYEESPRWLLPNLREYLSNLQLLTRKYY